MMHDRLSHRTHADLLDQVASSPEERDAVRRAFGVPLAAHELDTAARYRRAAVYPIRYAACLSGPCEQGRKLCPSPEVCQISAGRHDRSACAASRICDAADAPRPRRSAWDGLRIVALYAAGSAAIVVAAAIVAAVLGPMV